MEQEEVLVSASREFPTAPTERPVGPRPGAPTGEAERRIIADWRLQMLAELPADHPARARIQALRVTAAA